ncbi:endonuclease/exonuclease/phosphatase family protein, partial [Gammaproteobacteria bacterium]|nr:endonuclease/exonuclease/phosphatase family protein [Gammaproteobacteria bacterium]
RPTMTASSIRFATYNIQYGYGQDKSYNLDRIADAVAEADIICMQEVTTGWKACNGDHQPDLLSARLNKYAAYAPGYETDASHTDAGGRVVNKRRGFGNMVLSRWPIVYSRPHSLPRPPQEKVAETKADLPRCVLETVIDIPDVPLRIMSVHLSHQSRLQRLSQVAVLRALVDGLSDESPIWKEAGTSLNPWTEGKPVPPVVGSTIIAGDFNFQPADPEYAAMLEPRASHALIDAWAAANPGRDRATTCVESDGSLTTLDYAFLTVGLAGSITAARVENHTAASDHFPLLLELEL